MEQLLSPREPPPHWCCLLHKLQSQDGVGPAGRPLLCLHSWDPPDLLLLRPAPPTLRDRLPATMAIRGTSKSYFTPSPQPI